MWGDKRRTLALVNDRQNSDGLGFPLLRMPFVLRKLPSCLLGLVIAVLLMTSAANAAEKSREPFFPRSGNTGYDVRHYGVHLSYRPRSGALRASASLNALAKQRLRRFSLDLDGLEVTEVKVDNEPAHFSRGRGKLKVRPKTRIEARQGFNVFIRYQGRPRKITDPDGSQEGWYRTDDGALALGEPVGTAAWLPCNNVPKDKASFEISISVPSSLKAASTAASTRSSAVVAARRSSGPRRSR